jgi:hypothetical protein
MKSIFDKKIREAVIARIDLLNEDCKAKWGEMSVTQAVRHCSLCEAYYYGGVKVKRSFLGRIFGQTAIKSLLKDEATELKRNAPTSPQFKVREDLRDLEVEKQQWKSLVERYETYREEKFVHWFFGNMTKAQLGQFIYKHCDHHLRQFGV